VLEERVAERTREIQRYSRQLTTRVLRAQEEERKRIARELHDDTAQSLSSLLISMDILEPYLPEDGPILRTGFDRIRTIAKRTLDSTRALSHDLRPTILDDFGLVAALKWFADEYTRTFGVPVEVRAEHVSSDRLPGEIELALFRIAQEALMNSGKYAEATRTGVDLAFPDGMVRLVVTDNGKGFDPTAIAGPTRQGGLGLHGMQERADLIGADIAVDTAPGAGTRVTVTVPLSGHAVEPKDGGTRSGDELGPEEATRRGR
jgi:two-component system sensor histidine kinase UhpB